MTSIAPGPWLRTCALVASAGTLLAVVSGAAHLGTTHRLLAALVAPPLAALLVSAWLAHRELVPAVLGASALFTAAAALPGRYAHVTFAALALAALLVVTVQAFRGERVPWGSWRDYVTLTKPRIMSLLLITGLLRDDRRCTRLARHDARGVRDGRPRARVRWRERAQPRPRPRHRPADGRTDETPAGCVRSRQREPRGRVRPRALGVLVRLAREHGQPAHRGARARRQSLLRARLHPLAEALDAAEHRHRRSGRRGPAARRLGGGDRATSPSRHFSSS